jgi:outer membrane protein assembly factor BamD
VGRAHYYLGEALFAQKRQLEAAREFRRASDETPNDPIAPEALLRLGDVYADLWRRPELDPTYGQTALSTYQELLNRYPGSSAAKRGQLRVAELNERFATKEFKAGMFYFRLKAYDSAILYLKDVVATYPKATVVPEALIKLVQAYKALGYREDVQETCGYIRRFHPRAPQVGEVCPSKPAA